MTDIMIVFSDF